MSEHKRRTKRWERGGADRVPQVLEHWGRGPFYISCVISLALCAGATYLWLPLAVLFLPTLAYVVMGLGDALQTRHSVLRNFPVLGRMRYFLESVRPEIRQYFVESDQEENPFSREMRTVIYQRAKAVLDTSPFGTRRDVYAEGYEWIAHSIAPLHPEPETARMTIGQERCKKPYSASLFNISAMSYGALSTNAIRSLNRGAQMGGFYHNTGEGGISPYHLEPGGDLCWQVGTGYFGCRDHDGNFNPELFEKNATREQVRMIEIKLSQGAKPGHGGILPGEKVNEEIASIRGVRVGQTVHSPPQHSAFQGPTGLMRFVEQLRHLSGGKPVGFKLCVGQPVEFLAIVKAMLETGILPDFVTVDGAEGGTGAAPLEFSNSVGMPLADGLNFVHNALIGAGLRSQLRVISAGKIATGFHVVRQLALGADLTNSARGMMFALGCIQALKCNTNKCPVGVATQNPGLVKGLVVDEKAPRVASFHDRTIASLLELVGAAGLRSPNDLRPHHVFRRVSPAEVRHLGEIYPILEEGSLLNGTAPEAFKVLWQNADARRFATNYDLRPSQMAPRSMLGHRSS
jgi:glutamate synthase domain-containing protein 2